MVVLAMHEAFLAITSNITALDGSVLTIINATLEARKQLKTHKLILEALCGIAIGSAMHNNTFTLVEMSERTGAHSTHLRAWVAWGMAVAKMPHVLAFHWFNSKARSLVTTYVQVTTVVHIQQLTAIDPRYTHIFVLFSKYTHCCQIPSAVRHKGVPMDTQHKCSSTISALLS